MYVNVCMYVNECMYVNICMYVNVCLCKCMYVTLLQMYVHMYIM